MADLMEYFPYYKANQLPSRRYMFRILATFRFDEINNMIKNARKNRSAKTPDNENELVHITKAFYDEIKAVKSQKCKVAIITIWHLVSKGKASQMLKRSTKLIYNRKPARTYQLSFENLKKNNEEEKEEDDMS